MIPFLSHPPLSNIMIVKYPNCFLLFFLNFIVADVPQITLHLGSNLRHSHIQESNDVYFECIIKASPWVTEIRWHFEGREIQTNTTAGVIVSNQSLVLQKVLRHQRGKYTCSATNAEGEGESNSIHLRVQYAPVCKPGKLCLIPFTAKTFMNIPSIQSKYKAGNLVFIE